MSPAPSPRSLADFARRHPRGLRRALWAIVLLAVPAVAIIWPYGFPGVEDAEIGVKLSLTIAATALFTLHLLGRKGSTRVSPALVLAALIACAGYFNLGRMHGRGFVHHWEQFHYALSAKYFAELGHDGLYVASLSAEIQDFPLTVPPEYIRDLRSNEVVRGQSLGIARHRQEVRERFSDERWEAFRNDHREFSRATHSRYRGKWRMDHGFNAPPSWTFVAQRFAATPDFDARALIWFGCLDLCLLAVLFGVVFLTYGARTGCLALILFGLSYPGRFFWVGGAFLREDWLVALGIGVCMLHVRAYRTAGALFGYAAMVRVFPVLLMFGPAVLALSRALRGEDWRFARRMALGCFLAVLGLLALGSLAGRGPGAWIEFAETIRLHGDTWLTNNVGLENLILYGSDVLTRARVDFDRPEPWLATQEYLHELRADRLWLILAAKLAFLALLARACLRARPDEAAILSLGAVFCMVLTTCYYWQALVLLVLLRSNRVVYALLGLTIGMQILHLPSNAFELRYGVLSWALLVFFCVLYVSRARVHRGLQSSEARVDLD